MKLTILLTGLLMTAKIGMTQNAGIGTTTPTSPLMLMAPAGAGITQVNGAVEIGFYTSAASAFMQTWSSHSLFFGTNGPNFQMTLANTTGNVGIGTGSPSRKLDVDGTLRIRDGSPVAGAILTTKDADGNAEWTPVVTGGSKTMFIPFTAFVGAVAFMEHEPVNNVSRRSPGYLANTYQYQAPLLLPVGTVIKDITWHYFDNNVELNLTFSLVRELSSELSVVAETSSSGALNFDWSRNVVVNHTLGNYFYWLDISSFSWSSDASLRFKGALINYE